MNESRTVGPASDPPVVAPPSPPVVTGPGSRAPRRKVAVAVASGLGLVVLLAWLGGAIGRGRAGPGHPPSWSAAIGDTAVVESVTVADPREFVGTIRPRSVARVSARLLARVLDVPARMGQTVEAGAILARLDDRDVRARVEQAGLGLASAKAGLVNAESELGRTRALVERKAATASELDAAVARAEAARADVARLEAARREAEVLLGETSVRSPSRGRVLERHVEPGDMAAPGVPLFVVQAAEGLRVEAWVPESCAAAVNVGDPIVARLDASGREVEAVLDEIAPSSEPGSHTFLVKAALPAHAGARPGEFARLVRPCRERPALLVPATAVRSLGQLEVVTVVSEGRGRARHVRTGKRFGDRVEVLAGLEVGERVLVGAGP